MQDLILKNGRIIDMSTNYDSVGDIYIKDGKILEISPKICSSNEVTIIDCKGLLIVPGLIDMHAHIHPIYPRYEDSLPAFDGESYCIQNGVTTCVDAGTCGISDFENFYKNTIKKTKLNYFAFLNIATGGMVHLDTEQNIECLNPKQVSNMAKYYSDTIVGIKSAHYWVGKPFDDIHTPWASVDAAIQAGELANLPVMIDFQPNGEERKYDDLLLKHMRPGDIHTHVFAQQFHYFDDDGSISDYLIKAKEKGILFDLGHGRRSFWFRNSIPAIKQGFIPDTISTDLYSANVCGPVIGLMNVMSKMLACGMSLKEIISAVTINPAKIIGKPNLGKIVQGGIADIAVLKEYNGSFGFEDGGRTSQLGDSRFQCELTIKNGQVLFDKECRSLLNWEKAPKSYWESPGVVTY